MFQNDMVLNSSTTFMTQHEHEPLNGKSSFHAQRKVIKMENSI